MSAPHTYLKFEFHFISYPFAYSLLPTITLCLNDGGNAVTVKMKCVKLLDYSSTRPLFFYMSCWVYFLGKLLLFSLSLSRQLYIHPCFSSPICCYFRICNKTKNAPHYSFLLHVKLNDRPVVLCFILPSRAQGIIDFILEHSGGWFKAGHLSYARRISFAYIHTSCICANPGIVLR